MPRKLQFVRKPLTFALEPFEVVVEGAAPPGSGPGGGPAGGGPGGSAGPGGGGPGGSGGSPGGGSAGSAGSGAGGSGGGAEGGGGDHGEDSPPTAPIVVVQDAQQIAPVFSTDPTDQNIIANDDGSFFAAASGYPAYQWQFSSDGIAPFADLANGGIYSGVTTSTLRLSNVPIQYSGYVFRCVATNDGGTDTSGIATLTVSAPADKPYIITDPTAQTATRGGSAVFSITAGGTAPLVYQWQVSDDGGLTWANVPSTSPYSGAKTDTLTINPAT